MAGSRLSLQAGTTVSRLDPPPPGSEGQLPGALLPPTCPRPEAGGPTHLRHGLPAGTECDLRPAPPAEAPLGSGAPVLAGSWVHRSPGPLGARVGLVRRPADLPRGRSCSPSEPPGARRMEVTPLPRQQEDEADANPSAQKRQRGALAHLPRSFPQQDRPPGPRATHGRGGPEAPRGPRAKSEGG